jgi:hypothetical protein
VSGFCAGCGSPCPPRIGRPGHPRWYCSALCRHRAKSRRHGANRRARERALRALGMAERRCECCGGALPADLGRRPRRFCSDLCRGRGTAGVSHPTRECPQCGSLIAVRAHRSQRYCRVACRLASQRAAHLTKWRSAHPVVTRPCAFCTEPFASARPRQRFCSALCLNRDQNQRAYRASSNRHFPRIRGRQRLAIAVRDGWRCGICGAVIDPALRWPHPGSLSIDHVDPNGAHDPANWQASHLACNVAKGAQAA